MIPTILAMLQVHASTQPTIIELLEPSAATVSIAAVVKTGALDVHDLAVARVLAETVTKATADFNVSRMREYTLMAGRPMKCTLLSDCFRIELEMPRQELKLGISLLDGVLRHSRFEDESLADALSRLPFKARSYWSEALLPWKLNYEKIRKEEILKLYEKLFRPENTTVVVAGPFAAGEGASAVDEAINDWNAPRIYPLRYIVHPATEVVRHSAAISTFDFQGPEFKVDETSFAKNFLAAVALGMGKSSTLHRVVREANNWSYRQESALTPTPDGLRVRLLIARQQPESDEGVGEKMRSAISADVSAWKDADRSRAISLADMILMRGMPISPLYIGGNEWPLTDSLDDRAFMAAYWRMKTGKAWNPIEVLSMIDGVSLDDLKSTASDIVSKSELHMIPGS